MCQGPTLTRPNQKDFRARQSCPREPGTSKGHGGGRSLRSHQAEAWGPQPGRCRRSCASAFPGAMATCARPGDPHRALCPSAVSLGAGLRPSIPLRRETECFCSFSNLTHLAQSLSPLSSPGEEAGGREQHHADLTEVETEAQGLSAHPELGRSAQRPVRPGVTSPRPAAVGSQGLLAGQFEAPRCRGEKSPRSWVRA